MQDGMYKKDHIQLVNICNLWSKKTYILSVAK